MRGIVPCKIVVGLCRLMWHSLCVCCVECTNDSVLNPITLSSASLNLTFIGNQWLSLTIPLTDIGLHGYIHVYMCIWVKVMCFGKWMLVRSPRPVLCWGCKRLRIGVVCRYQMSEIRWESPWYNWVNRLTGKCFPVSHLFLKTWQNSYGGHLSYVYVIYMKDYA